MQINKNNYRFSSLALNAEQVEQRRLNQVCILYFITSINNNFIYTTTREISAIWLA